MLLAHDLPTGQASEGQHGGLPVRGGDGPTMLRLVRKGRAELRHSSFRFKGRDGREAHFPLIPEDDQESNRNMDRLLDRPRDRSRRSCSSPLHPMGAPSALRFFFVKPAGEDGRSTRFFPVCNDFEENGVRLSQRDGRRVWKIVGKDIAEKGAREHAASRTAALPRRPTPFHRTASPPPRYTVAGSRWPMSDLAMK